MGKSTDGSGESNPEGVTDMASQYFVGVVVDPVPSDEHEREVEEPDEPGDRSGK